MFVKKHLSLKMGFSGLVKTKITNYFQNRAKQLLHGFVISAVVLSNLAPVFAQASNEPSLFPYGVIAVNTDQAYYEPGQNVYVQLGSLDSTGHTLCNSNLQLDITGPEGYNEKFDTNQAAGSIQHSPTCGNDNVTDSPDYFLNFPAPETQGMYQLALTNLDSGIQVKNIFQVASDLPFTVQRKTATRINPFKSSYQVHLTVTARENFTGQLEEFVQNGFELSQYGQAKIKTLTDSKNGSYSELIWPVQIQAGQTLELSYTYSAPQVSPELFSLGFLQLRSASLAEAFNGAKGEYTGSVIYGEGRPWQIASDSAQVKSGNFNSRTTTGAQSVTGLGFQPKAIIFYWTFQNTDNAFTNTGAASTASARANMGMGIASQTGTATSSRCVAIIDDSTGSSGTTSDSKQRISSTSTIMLLSGGNPTGVAATGVMARAVVTTMDSDGFTLNWTTATATAAIIRYYAIGGSDITNATTATFTLGTASSGPQSITGLGFAPDFVFYLAADTASYDTNIADSNMTFGFSTAATSTQQGMESFASNDAANTGVTRNTQTTASSSGALSSAVTAVDYAFRTWSLDSNGFTINVGNVPSANLPIFYMALKGGQYFVGSTTTPSSTGKYSVNGLGFEPEGLFVTTNNLAPSGAVQNNIQISIGTTGWATTTGVSATSSTGLIGYAQVNGDGNPSENFDTRSNSLVKGYTPVSTDVTNPTVNFEAVADSFDSNGFTLNYTTAASGKQILFWGIGSNPNVSGNVYSDEGSTGLANSRTIKLSVYNGTATTTYSTTTVASTGKFDFYNVYAKTGNILTIYLSGAAEKAVTVSQTDGVILTGLNLYQNRVIVRSEDGITVTNADLAGVDSDNDAGILFTANSGTLSLSSGSKLIVWANDSFTPGGSVTTAATSTASTQGGDLTIQSGATLDMGTNALSIGGDFVNQGSFSKSTGQTTTFTATGSGFIIATSTGNFENLVFNGSGGSWTAANNLVLDGDLTLTAGTLNSTSSNITVAGGNVTGNGVINLSAGTFEIRGTGSFGGTSDWTFYNLNIGNGAAASTTAIGSGTVTVSSVLTIGSTSELNAGIKTFTLVSSGTPFTITSGGRFTASTSLVSFTAAGTTTIPSLAYYNLGISPVSGNPIFNFSSGSWVTATSTGFNNIVSAFAFDSANGVMYASVNTTGNGKILKCIISSDCTIPGSWRFATSTAPDSILSSMVYDSAAGAIYASGGNSGNIYRCLTSSLCVTNTSWSVATTTIEVLSSLGYDSANGVIYAGGGSAGRIFKCSSASGCVSMPDWTMATDTPQDAIYNFVYDSANGAMYAGTGLNGIILKCLVTSGCDSVQDWTLATTTVDIGMNSLAYDSVNSVIYAGSNSSGKIYRCQASTGCNSTGNWTVSTTTSDQNITALLFDSVHNILYAATNVDGSFGSIYKCRVSTGCDSVSDWTLDTTSLYVINTLGFDSSNGTVYAGKDAYIVILNSPQLSVANNLTLAGAGNATLDLNTDGVGLTVGGNLTIGSGDTFSAAGSATTTINGNLINAGTFTHNNGTVVFAPTATSTITSSSSMAFYKLEIFAPSKALQFMASTTAYFTIANNFIVSGSSTNLITIRSNISSSQWTVHFNSTQASGNIVYAYITDSGCHTGSSNANVSDGTSTDAGNNGICWVFIGAAPSISYGGGAGSIDNGQGYGVLVIGGGSGGGSSGGGGGAPPTEGGGGGQPPVDGGGGGGGGATP